MKSKPEETVRLGAILRKYREAAGVTRRTVSVVLDCTEGTVNNWETGVRMPTIDKAITLCQLYGISLRDLDDEPVAAGKGS